MGMKITSGAFGRGGSSGLTFMQQARQERQKKERIAQEKERFLQEEREEWLAVMGDGQEVSIEYPENGTYQQQELASKKMRRLIDLAKSEERFCWVVYRQQTSISRVRCWIHANQIEVKAVG